MNEPQFGNKIRQLLNEGTAVDAGVRARLEVAHTQALAGQRIGGGAGYAPVRGLLMRFGGALGVSLRVVLPAALLTTALVGIYTWQQNQHVAEIAAIDAKLLAGELPIGAYIDRGFETWLKTHAPG